jgi:iron complex outermembrane recepter protein
MVRAFLAFSALVFAMAAGSQPRAQPAADGETYPVVLTPTRMRQPLQDVPASVTVITSDTLRRFGIMNVPDALRLVPGMAIAQPSGADYRIGYHGTNILTPRRMNVLIDGVSVYRPAFARVDWKQLPVAIEDIDRIEVTRGPNSAAYGPNSMLAVVNIITKHPNDVEPALLTATFGSLDTTSVTGRVGATLGPTELRLTLNRERDRGYDFLSRIGSDHDSTRIDRLNLRTQTRLNDSTTLDLDAAYVRGLKQVPFAEQFQTSFPDQRIEDYYLSGTLTRSLSANHEVQVRAYYASNRVRQTWRSCLPTALLLPEMFELWRANPAYANAILAGVPPVGGTPEDDALALSAQQAIARLGAGATKPTCVNANQNLVERRTDIELQDTLVFSERARLVAGIGARQQQGDSETYLGGNVSNAIWRLFANLEFKPSTWISLNGGAYAERDRFAGTSISPRLAANFQLSPHQTVRLVWSTGSRTPDIQEQRADWSYSLDALVPRLGGSRRGRFFQSASSPGGLDHERISSTEIGYLLAVPSLGLLLDAKFFDDRLRHLISEKLQVSDFAPSNDNSLRLSGAELQVDVALTPMWSAFMRYAYLDQHDASTPLERTQYSRHSGAIGLSQQLGTGWHWSFAYYGASANGLGQRHYGRSDLSLGKDFSIDATRASAMLTVRRLDNRTSSYFQDFGSAPVSRYQNRLQVFGQLGARF